MIFQPAITVSCSLLNQQQTLLYQTPFIRPAFCCWEGLPNNAFYPQLAWESLWDMEVTAGLASTQVCLYYWRQGVGNVSFMDWGTHQFS